MQIDAFTSRPMWAPWSPPDGYGPMIMALLEHTALRLGVVPRPPDSSMGPLRSSAGGTLLWTALHEVTQAAAAGSGGAPSSNYTQELGAHTYSLLVDGAAEQMSGWMDGSRKLFSCSVGVRVITTLDGRVNGLVGISQTAVQVTLSTPSGSLRNQAVLPNEEWSVEAEPSADRQPGSANTTLRRSLLRRSPFVPPFG